MLLRLLLVLKYLANIQAHFGQWPPEIGWRGLSELDVSSQYFTPSLFSLQLKVIALWLLHVSFRNSFGTAIYMENSQDWGDSEQRPETLPFSGTFNYVLKSRLCVSTQRLTYAFEWKCCAVRSITKMTYCISFTRATLRNRWRFPVFEGNWWKPEVTDTACSKEKYYKFSKHFL